MIWFRTDEFNQDFEPGMGLVTNYYHLDYYPDRTDYHLSNVH